MTQVPVLSRFGKASRAWFDAKDFFYSRDQELASYAKSIADIYIKQPKRSKCKVCENGLSSEKSFKKNGVSYVLCGLCGHFNGLHEDTDAFNRAVYLEDANQIYQIAYSTSDRESYHSRVSSIYIPKAEFLAEALASDGVDPKNLEVVDFGSGAGYFVSALQNTGFSAKGFEVSSEQVLYANKFLGADVLKKIDMQDLGRLIDETTASVVSFIFVLEHLSDPVGLLRKAARNPSIRYVYFSVPMFSASVFFEMAFSNLYHRHLSAGHTHLFSEMSLRWIEDSIGFHRVAEWWFGLDIVDLVRLMGIHFDSKAETKEAMELWNGMMMPVLDSLQKEIDQRRLSSEVHMLWRVKQ